MKDDILTQTFLEMQRTLGNIDSKLESLCEVIKNHESRITDLEKSTVKDKKDDFKDEMLRFLMKALISLIAIVGSLTGAGALLQKILEK